MASTAETDPPSTIGARASPHGPILQRSSRGLTSAGRFVRLPRVAPALRRGGGRGSRSAHNLGGGGSSSRSAHDLGSRSSAHDLGSIPDHHHHHRHRRARGARTAAAAAAPPTPQQHLQPPFCIPRPPGAPRSEPRRSALALLTQLPRTAACWMRVRTGPPHPGWHDAPAAKQLNNMEASKTAGGLGGGGGGGGGGSARRFPKLARRRAAAEHWELCWAELRGGFILLTRQASFDSGPAAAAATSQNHHHGNGFLPLGFAPRRNDVRILHAQAPNEYNRFMLDEDEEEDEEDDDGDSDDVIGHGDGGDHGAKRGQDKSDSEMKYGGARVSGTGAAGNGRHHGARDKGQRKAFMPEAKSAGGGARRHPRPRPRLPVPSPGYSQTHVDHIFCVTRCNVTVRDDQLGSGIIVHIAAENSESITVAFESRAEADPFLWALAVTVSPYESLSLGSFEIISPLGAGAYGKVYLIRDVRTNERLALKVLDKNLVFSDNLHFNSAVNERLTLELTCGHPFLATFRYATQTARYLYLVTDFYEGGDLFNFLKTHHASMREVHAIRIIAEVVLGLEAMHAMRLVYRDLKPENILLDSEGHVRIADLGLAKRLTSDTSFLTSTICGSIVYAGPEMLAGETYGIPFDQWTLGVFIYQVLTGDLPFQTDDVKLEDILVEQRSGVIRQGVLSDDAYSLVKQLLNRDPAKRPTSQQIQAHAFFKDIDWLALEAKEPHEYSLLSIMHKTAARSLGKLPRVEGKDACQTTDVPDSNASSGDSLHVTQGEAISPLKEAAISHHDRMNQFLLRHFDPDEWSNMSFSDASDGQSVSDAFRGPFIPLETSDSDRRRAQETRMIPGWNFRNRSGNWRPARYPKPSTNAIEDGVRRQRGAWKERWHPTFGRAQNRR